MKISKIFHFLYFSVLSIPLISMPIFAIYSQNHEITGYEVTQEVNKAVDFNQQWDDTNRFNLWANASSANYVDNAYRLLATNNVNTYAQFYNYNSFDAVINHKYLFRVTTNEIPGYTFPNYYIQISNTNSVIKSTSGYFEGIITSNLTQKRISIYFQDGTNLGLDLLNLNIYDLTQIFGVGNEPTIEEFNTYFPNSYYPYTESQEVVIENYETITYNDTDIMSQFIYNEYNFMDKYLGIYKFSPFNDIYNWLQNTFFDGAAPMVFIIFYQWFAYWLFVSLCWLIFDVLMYVPLMIHKWLDKAEL